MACKELDLILNREKKTWRWYGSWEADFSESNAAYRNGISVEDYGRCEHAIGVKDNDKAYEIGLVRAPDGVGYRLVFDFFAGGYGLMEKVGDDCQKLRQEYAIAQNTAIAHKQGYRVLRAPANAEGKIKLTLVR